MKSSVKLLFLLLFVLLICKLAFKNLLETERIMLLFYNNQISNEDIERILAFKDKWDWLLYLIYFFIVSLKIFVIAAILDIGCFFFGKDIRYKTLFHIAVNAEFVLVIVFKTAWFYFFYFFFIILTSFDAQKSTFYKRNTYVFQLYVFDF